MQKILAFPHQEERLSVKTANVSYVQSGQTHCICVGCSRRRILVSQELGAVQPSAGGSSVPTPPPQDQVCGGK